MDLLEVSIEADGEAAEAISEIFNRYGEGGAVVEEQPGVALRSPMVLKTYLPEDADLEQRRLQLEEALWHLRQIYPFPEPQFCTLAERDWANAWKERYCIQHVGDHLIVRPSWLDYTPKPWEIVVTLDPGLAFGTGLHPTTRLCLIELKKRLHPSMRVLDLGTGSGILAVFAAKLGAGSVLALDTDSTAVDVARANIALNGVEAQVQAMVGSLREEGDGASQKLVYDMIMVNILAQVIKELAPNLTMALAPGGLLIASGIIDDQIESTESVLEVEGVKIVDRHRQGDWVALVGKKSSSRPES
jgi:ribosomal protein L11 methyltransferase